MALAATGAFFIWRSLAGLPLGTIDNPGPAAMPLALAVLLVVFALWSLGSASSACSIRRPTTTMRLTRTAAACATPSSSSPPCVAAAVALDRLGYRLTILCLLLFFLGLVERKPIVTALVVSATLSFGSHALFVHVLKIPLPSGPMGI